MARTHCNRGHRLTEKTTRPCKRSRSGKTYFACCCCESLRRKEKYRTDPSYRAKIRAANRRYRERHGLVPPTFEVIMAMVIPDKGQYRCS